MYVDEAGGHDKPRRVESLLRAADIVADCDDAAVPDADIGAHALPTGSVDNLAPPDRQLQRAQTRLHRLGPIGGTLSI
jgi:hypothetical protein